MEEKDSAISGPSEEFRICFCGQSRSGSEEGSVVRWYLIDVSVKEACLSEKTESSTRKLNPFSVSYLLSSYAALGGLIYSLGGRYRSPGGGDTLFDDVWLLDYKSFVDLKPGSILPQPDSGKAHIGEDLKPGSILPQPDSGKAHIGEDLKPGSILPQPDSGKAHIGEDLKPGSILPQPDSGKAHIGEDLKPGPILPQPDSGKAHIGEDLKPGSILSQPSSGKAHIGEYWKPDSDKAQAQAHWPKKSPRPPGYARWNTEFLSCVEDLAFKEAKLETRPSFSGAKKWTRGRRMNFARYDPHTMVVDHKLYVLGGFLPNQNQADGWIEVFDPEEKRWESLPSPPDEFQIHSSIMISGLLKSKKEIVIAKQRWDCLPLLFFSYNITTRCWNELSLHSDSKASVHSNVERAVILRPNNGRAVTVGNTLYWISTEEHNDECTIHAYDLDRNMWFEDHLNTATIFERREYFSSIYSRGPGFLHLVDQKFCLLLQSTVTTKDPQSSIEYLYCVILNISPIYEHAHEDWGKFELTTVSVQKYSMDHYIDFLDCMLLDRVSGVKSVDHGGQSTSTNISFQE